MAAIRGDLKNSTRPITLSNAARFTERPIEMTVVLNTPFSIIRTLNKPTLGLKTYFNKSEEAENIVSPVHMGTGEPMPEKPNIVIFIIESFGKDLSGALNTDLYNGDYDGYMPFLDSLMMEGKSYKYAFANGKKSIDALPSILCGVPDFGTNYVLSHYVNDSLKGLPALLEEEGYYTAFFHGAPNGSMGLDAIAKLAGFSDYYGLDEYGNDEDFDGYWGIWDELFLQYFANKMQEFKEPFMTTVFTLSSHHPFQLPPGYEGRFKEGPIPLDRAVQYTDNALRQFFKNVNKMPWFKNTLFVFTADHSAQVNHIEYKNDVGGYSVPLIFYKPDNDEFNTGMDTTRIVQHIDIIPTLLSYIKYPKDFFAFGKNIFDRQAPNYIWYYSGSWNLIDDNYLCQFDGEKSIALHEYKKDRTLQNNILLENMTISDSLSNIIKAHIQVFNHRIITNQLIPERIQELNNLNVNSLTQSD
jgi:phosphoglycerol transferase MdoB-like AlkP superfamily enzyme